MILFFKVQKQLFWLCCAVPLLDLCWKLSPGYQKKKLYMVHAKLDIAGKCNWATRWIKKKKKKPSVDKKEIDTPALLIRSHLGPVEISPVKTLESYPALTLTPILSPILKVVPFPSILKRFWSLLASHTLQIPLHTFWSVLPIRSEKVYQRRGTSSVVPVTPGFGHSGSKLLPPSPTSLLSRLVCYKQ